MTWLFGQPKARVPVREVYVLVGRSLALDL
jgi:hypothetical protein